MLLTGYKICYSLQPFTLLQAITMQISPDRVVTLHYTLKDDDGNIIDQSDDGSFLYLHGAMNIVPGLEKALTGRRSGDEFSIKIPPEEAYGVKDPERIQEVPRDMFENNDELAVGAQFHAQGPDGDAIVVTIAQINEDNIVVDGNHSLAGMTLNFDVEVMDVREALEEEISHGHVHDPHGHQH